PVGAAGGGVAGFRRGRRGCPEGVGEPGADRVAVRGDHPVADQIGTAGHVGTYRDVHVVAGDRDVTLVDALAIRPDYVDLVPDRRYVLGERDDDLERRVLGDGALDRRGTHQGGVRAGRPGRQREHGEHTEHDSGEPPHRATRT